MEEGVQGGGCSPACPPLHPLPMGPSPLPAEPGEGGREGALRGGLVTHRPVSLLRNLPPHTHPGLWGEQGR